MLSERPIKNSDLKKNSDFKSEVARQWKKTHASVITSLMANIVWKILIPQIYVDFHSWKTVDAQEKYCLKISFK